MLESMMTSPIAVVERPISSKWVRFTAEDSVGSFLLTMLKRGLKSEGVEIALLQVFLHACRTLFLCFSLSLSLSPQ